MAVQLERVGRDELKIDRSFISQADASAATIVTSTIERGHSLGLKVVAEGVARGTCCAGWAATSRRAYLISPPLLLTQVAPFVREANRLLPASDSSVLQIEALAQLTPRKGAR